MLCTKNLWQAPVVIVIAHRCSKSVFRTIACHHRRRLFQGAAIFVVLDVGVSPSFGSRCRLPAMALPTHLGRICRAHKICTWRFLRFTCTCRRDGGIVGVSCRPTWFSGEVFRTVFCWLLTVINCAATMPVAPPEPFLRPLATPSFWQEINAKNVNKKS